MNDICFELSSSWQSDFDTTPIKLQRIRHRQRLPSLFLRKLRGKVRENLGEVANAYRSKHMCALSRPAVIQTCLSSSATPILIRPEELRIGLLGNMDRHLEMVNRNQNQRAINLVIKPARGDKCADLVVGIDVNRPARRDRVVNCAN